jgi:hypothetical protein
MDIYPHGLKILGPNFLVKPRPSGLARGSAGGMDTLLRNHGALNAELS